jgi:hypothetical protein
MDSALHTVVDRSTSKETLRVVANGQLLAASAVYRLSETGRKALLLSGGDGRAIQRTIVQVPAGRLHLVSVDVNGNARLKLQPRFEVTADHQVIRRQGPPTYAVPPTVEDLFGDAAKNHELERRFESERSLSWNRRRDADRERRLHLAQEFLSDTSRRAMAHPMPTPTRCILATDGGRVMFDAYADVGLARDLPRDAFRRYLAELRSQRERNRQRRAREETLHAEKDRVVAAWIASHGSEDQRSRHAAGLLPLTEVIDALTDEAFAPTISVPAYQPDGAVRLQERLRALTGRMDIVVAPADLQVLGKDAAEASSAQWDVMEWLRMLVPDAEISLREHRLSSRRDATLPALSVFGVLVTRRVGPFILRREFAAPES